MSSQKLMVASAGLPVWHLNIFCDFFPSMGHARSVHDAWQPCPVAMNHDNHPNLALNEICELLVYRKETLEIESEQHLMKFPTNTATMLSISSVPNFTTRKTAKLQRIDGHKDVFF